MKIFLLTIVFLCGIITAGEQKECATQGDNLWTITFYCPCKICCGKDARGITASGKKASVGMVACNILPFGTVVWIEGLGNRTIEDRGAKRLFDSKRRIDIFVRSHDEARKPGIAKRRVKVIK